MARTSVTVTMDLNAGNPATLADKVTKSGREAAIKAMKQLEGAIQGTRKVGQCLLTFDGAQPVAACQTVACASVVATDTLVINGQALTAVAGAAGANQFSIDGASDILDCTALVAAINLSTNAAIITKHVEASNLAAVITLASCTAGSGVRIAGYDFIAYSTTPTNPPNDGSFSIAGNDTADGDSLVTAINTHPVLCHKVFAINNAGTVTVRQRRGTTSIGRCEVIATAALGVASGITVGSSALSVAFAATATALVSSKFESVAGNAVTISSTGGTMTVGAARLTGGTGGDGSQVRYIPGTVM